MASRINDQRNLRIACGQLITDDVNAGTIVIPNSKSRRIFIQDAWVRAIGTAGGSTAIVYLREYLPNIVCATASVNDTVTVNGYIFTAKAATAIPSRQFINTNDAAAATALAACINDPTWGVPGVTALVSTATVTLISGTTTALTTSNSTRLATDSGGNAFVTFTKASLADGAIVRAGKTGGTAAVYLGNPGVTRNAVELICPTADLATTTALDYVVKYSVL